MTLPLDLPSLLLVIGVVGTIIGIAANSAKIHEYWVDRRFRKYPKEEPTKCEFLNFGLLLQITDPATMMVHHAITRRIKNISKKPLEQHFAFLFGDVPRSWNNLNLCVRGEGGNPIAIKEVNLDSPTRKEFSIELKPPLYPNEDTLYTVEWDWEEPQQYFEYTFVTLCRSSQVELIFPATKNYELSVYEVIRETREKRASDIKPKKRMIVGNEAKIVWSRDDIDMNTILRFEWQEPKAGS
jgi:hypothetical protein